MSNHNYLPTEYQKYIYTSRYARWLPDEQRRETWPETVDRYVSFFEEHLKDTCSYDVPEDIKQEVTDAILNLEVMPSMRALMTAGPALKRENLAGFNCAYIAIDRVTAFDEIMYVLMNGTGVGFSVERQDINKLPLVAEEFHRSDTTITVADSKIGWSKALREILHLLYAGQIPKWDTSKVRKAGSILKTFGGRASGPEPLEKVFNFAVNMFTNAAGRRLTSLECHDLACSIAEAIVVGGVRRSAMISLSNLSDDRMRDAKTGQWWHSDAQRSMANNSAVYTDKPDIGIFIKEWLALYESKSGERGIFNREAATKKVQENGRRDSEHEFGTNPCGEILLRPCGLCNLSEVVIRASDSADDIKRKVRIATILGTWQSTLTNFRYVSKKWQRNAEEERLLGVSLTGIKDNSLTSGAQGFTHLKNVLTEWKEHAIETNAKFAADMGINPSAAITTVKPSGTVSQLVDSSSGIHARYAPYYIRRVRASKNESIGKFMVQEGFPVEDDLMSPERTHVFSFPIKSPSDATYSKDEPATRQLEHWLIYRQAWCEHNPSVTINVKEDEWLKVGSWVYENFDDIGGVSFLPYSHSYQQAPYEEVDEDAYNELKDSMPDDIDWKKLAAFETEDMTLGSQTMACSGGVCEVVDAVR